MQKFVIVGLLVILAGFALVFFGAAGQGSVSTGGVIFIGPFPIVFGSGPNGWPLALVSLVIGVIMVAFILLWGVRFASVRKE